jgi:hypothetical protein
MSNSNTNKNYTLYFFLIAITVGIICGIGPFKKLQRDKKDEVHSYSNKPSFNDRNKNKIDIDSVFVKSYINKNYKKYYKNLSIKSRYEVDTNLLKK